MRSNLTDSSSWERDASWMSNRGSALPSLRGSRYFFFASLKAVTAVVDTRRRWISGMGDVDGVEDAIVLKELMIRENMGSVEELEEKDEERKA